MTAEIHAVAGDGAPRLKDMSLFRQQAYVDGAWIDADSGETIDVFNPGHGPGPGHDPQAGRRRDPPRHRGRRSRLAGLARQARQGARQYLAQMVRPHDREPGRPGGPHDHGAGQAAGRGARRGRLWRELRRVVRRGGQAGLRRHHPAAPTRQAPGGHQAAHRGGRRDHALELPQRHDHPQVRPGAGRRLPGGDQAGDGHALFGICAGRAGRSRRTPPGRAQHRHRRLGRHRRRAHGQPHGAQALLHRLDPGRQALDEAVRRDGEEGEHGARRQRALPGLRRRGSRRRRRGRHDEQVPQHRADLRLRQPHPGAGQRFTTPSRPSWPRRWPASRSATAWTTA